MRRQLQGRTWTHADTRASGEGRRTVGGRSGVTRGTPEADREFCRWGRRFFCWALSTVVAWERRQYASAAPALSSRTLVPGKRGRTPFAQTHQVRRRQLELQAPSSRRDEDRRVG